MELPLLKMTAARGSEDHLEKRLLEVIEGEVRFDPLARTLWSTDASIYEIVPVGVVLPKTIHDVVETVRVCRERRVPIVPRGAGTGLTGGAVGEGIQVDVSRHLTAIGRIDAKGRTVEVQPGVVLDELNAALAPFGLHFAPDVATGSRATIGGMIANNACGARSIIHGRTVDHVLELTVVLGDGSLAAFAPTPTNRAHLDAPHLLAPNTASAQRARAIRDGLGLIRDEHADEIQRRFPKVLRSNGGYGLDRLGPPATPADPIKVLCGSEGTLGIIVGAKLKLTPLPNCIALVIVHFDSVLEALATTPDILTYQPSAVELVDRMVLDAARRNPALGRRRNFLSGDPGAILIVEFLADDDATLRRNTGRLTAGLKRTHPDAPAIELLDQAEQADVWAVRSGGLGLLMSRPGDQQAYAFVEDTAVDPSRLRDYIERFSELLAREGVPQAGYYAHAGAGCIHVRPVLNLKDMRDVDRMGRVAEGVSRLVLEFGGAMTGEHGDGIVRSCWLEKMYGPNIIRAFHQVKHLFDPDNVLNPGKIVDPQPMTENLRYGAPFKTRPVKTAIDFSPHAGMAELAGMCSGVGVCRQKLVGTMCPSYMATGDETHTTRARANALRVALSNRGLLDGLDDPHLAQTMDLCISCKACKTECPTGVDMARLKAEYQNHVNLRRGASRRARFIADTPAMLKRASRFPRLSNLIFRSRAFRRLMEWRYGLDRRIQPPALATQTFRRWFSKHRAAGFSPCGTGFPTCHSTGWKADPTHTAQAEACGSGRGRVVYFVDTWTNYFTPQVGIAAVKLLEAAGFEVLCPAHGCCGRPMISQGLLGEAKQLAEMNLRALLRFAREGVPIIGTEPSCILTFVDEMPDLLRLGGTRHLAAQACTIESFLIDLLESDPEALRFVPGSVHLGAPTKVASPLVGDDAGTPPTRGDATSVLYHAHCHQKALVGSSDALRLLQRAFGEAASEINSGCCGMAGAFGHEKEHYDVARAIGEQRLFPAVRAGLSSARCTCGTGLQPVESQVGENPLPDGRGSVPCHIAVSGFSCRQQIQHHTGVPVHHVVELLAKALQP